MLTPDTALETVLIPARKVDYNTRLANGHGVYNVGRAVFEEDSVVIAAGWDGDIGASVHHNDDLVEVRRFKIVRRPLGYNVVDLADDSIAAEFGDRAAADAWVEAR